MTSDEIAGANSAIDELITQLKLYALQNFPEFNFEQKWMQMNDQNLTFTDVSNEDARYNQQVADKYPLVSEIPWSNSLACVLLAKRTLSDGKSNKKDFYNLINEAKLFFNIQNDEKMRLLQQHGTEHFRQHGLPHLGGIAKNQHYIKLKQKMKELLLKDTPPRKWKTAKDAARSIEKEILAYNDLLFKEANAAKENKEPYSRSSTAKAALTNIINLLSRYINADKELKEKIIDNTLKRDKK